MRDPIETHDLESQPHIMLTMVPGFEGDEKLLRGEALAILEASWDKGHKIIPVCSSFIISSFAMYNSTALLDCF